MSSPEVASLVRELAQIRRELRDLATGNPLNNAEFTTAAGVAVPLSSLILGSTAADAPQLMSLTGTANSVGGVDWQVSTGPWVNVLVRNGKLRVDIAAALAASGNKCSMFMSYAVLGPSETQPTGQLTNLLIAPTYGRSIEIQHGGAAGQDTRGGFGTWGFDEQLASGWYTVGARYALSYSSSSSAPYGEAQYRRIMATPY